MISERIRRHLHLPGHSVDVENSGRRISETVTGFNKDRCESDDLCVLDIYPIACPKSSIRSSTSSMPTLKRISPSERPFFNRSSRGIDAWVIVAG